MQGIAGAKTLYEICEAPFIPDGLAKSLMELTDNKFAKICVHVCKPANYRPALWLPGASCPISIDP